MHTNQDYSPGLIVPLLDASATALADFRAVELQVLMFFASSTLVRAGGFSEEDPSIHFCYLRRNLIVSFSWCDCDSWTGCSRHSYIQHACYKDVSLAGLS